MAIKQLQDADALLLYKVGPVYCCSPTLTVEAVILPPKLTRAPGYSEAEPGVFKHACGIVHVVDLRKRFGIEHDDWIDPGRIILVEVEGGYAGFWVDEILDVIHFPDKGWSNVPACIPRTVFKRTLLLNNDIQLYCDFEALYEFKETGYLREYIANLDSVKGSKQRILPADNLKTTVNDESSVNQEIKNKSIVESSNNKKPMSLPEAEYNQLNSGRDEQVELLVTKDEITIVVDDKKSDQKIAPSLTVKTHIETIESSSLNDGLVSEGSENIKLSLDNRGSLYVSDKACHYPENITSVVIADIHEGNDDKRFLLAIFSVFFLAIFIAGYFLDFTGEHQDVSDEKADAHNAHKIVDSVIYEPVKDVVENVVLVDPTEKKISSDYYAEINRTEDEVTIVINAPDVKAHDNELVNNNIIDISGSEKNEITNGSSKVVIEKSKNKIIINEINHIVVKGDTLWSIAKRYIKDPYRYPELARLSKIKNPDLIYPGNRVRIIVNSKSE